MMEGQERDLKRATQPRRNEIEEFALIEKVLSGTTDLYEVLIAPYRRQLLVQASRIVRSPDEAQDVLQEGLWKSFKYLATFRKESSFDSWVTKIVVNEARMSLRRSSRHRCSAFTPELENVCYSPHSEVLEEPRGERESRVLEAVIEELPQTYRAAILLRLGKMSTRECSLQLRISLSAFKSRHFRALKLLRQRLNPDGSYYAVRRAPVKDALAGPGA